jgi:hypothetical protein
MAAQLPLRDRHGDSRVEVRVYRFGLLKICEWCDSEEDAAALVDMWCVKDGTRCEVHRRSA